jgi:Tol biopolymer transport system component
MAAFAACLPGPAQGADIVFERGSSLWVADSDGAGQEEIPSSHPSTGGHLGPDGTTVFYRRHLASGTYELRAYDLGSGTTEVLRSGSSAAPWWFEDATEDLFISLHDDLKRLNTVTGAVSSWAPSLAGGEGALTFSRDGARATFVNGFQGGQGPDESVIYTLNGDGSGASPLDFSSVTPGGGGVGQPALSPDGSRIAFQLIDWLGRYRIYVANYDGTNPTPLFSVDQGGVGLPTWAPDGDRIGFTHWSGGTAAFKTMRPDGTDVQTLIQNAANGRFKQPVGSATLATRFRPRFHFDSDEPYRPLDVDQFFAEGNVFLGGRASGLRR